MPVITKVKAHKMGQPTRLTPKVQEIVVSKIELGMPYNMACMAAGIAVSTFYTWVKRGTEWREKIQAANEKNETIEVPAAEFRYMDFVEAIARADTVCMEYHLINIENKAVDNPALSQWMLMYKYGEHFKPPAQRHEADVNTRTTVKVVRGEDYDLV